MPAGTLSIDCSCTACTQIYTLLPAVIIRHVTGHRGKKMADIEMLEKKYESLQQEAIALAAKMGKYENDFLAVVCNKMGRGVVAKKTIPRGQFVCQYEGELISYTEGRRRNLTGNTCFLFFFKLSEKSWCLDASEENFTFGRLINHSRCNQNVKPKACNANGHPGIQFVSLMDIPPGVELFYDYGERNRDLLKENPWLLR